MTQEEALHWIAELFEEPRENITPETDRKAIPAWDSLGVLTLMAALDEKFNIILSDKDVRGMEKVADLLQILRRNGKPT
ncbi:MAG: hypothetical protein DME18_09350 [Verrucomicrobia bacterium]|nr:MAG: hypothetical protein DME18_09350 [Verrucomicrobiota bacterium]